MQYETVESNYFAVCLALAFQQDFKALDTKLTHHYCNIMESTTFCFVL